MAARHSKLVGSDGSIWERRSFEPAGEPHCQADCVREKSDHISFDARRSRLPRRLYSSKTMVESGQAMEFACPETLGEPPSG